MQYIGYYVCSGIELGKIRIIPSSNIENRP